MRAVHGIDAEKLRANSYYFLCRTVRIRLGLYKRVSLSRPHQSRLRRASFPGGEASWGGTDSPELVRTFKVVLPLISQGYALPASPEGKLVGRTIVGIRLSAPAFEK